MKKLLYRIVLLLPLLLISCVAGDNGGGQYIEAGDHIPSFTLHAPAGADYGDLSAAAFDDKKGMIVFFASYCPSCRDVMGRIQQVWDMLGEDDEYVIAVVSRQSEDESTYESSAMVAEYWSEQGYTMPYYLDTDRTAYDKFARTTVPRIYAVDNGIVTWMSAGGLDKTANELANIIKSE